MTIPCLNRLNWVTSAAFCGVILLLAASVGAGVALGVSEADAFFEGESGEAVLVGMYSAVGLDG